MNDFADFSQQEAFPGTDDGFGQMNGGVQMSGQDDVFADAGLPSMSTGPDMSQGFVGSPAPAEDYTDEELQLLRQVEEQNEERKRMLYEKMQKESEQKRERKAQAQIKLQEWKHERDSMAAGKK